LYYPLGGFFCDAPLPHHSDKERGLGELNEFREFSD
jgi:hypothetical protein